MLCRSTSSCRNGCRRVKRCICLRFTWSWRLARMAGNGRFPTKTSLLSKSKPKKTQNSSMKKSMSPISQKTLLTWPNITINSLPKSLQTKNSSKHWKKHIKIYQKPTKTNKTHFFRFFTFLFKDPLWLWWFERDVVGREAPSGAALPGRPTGQRQARTWAGLGRGFAAQVGGRVQRGWWLMSLESFLPLKKSSLLNSSFWFSFSDLFFFPERFIFLGVFFKALIKRRWVDSGRFLAFWSDLFKFFDRFT